MFFFMTHWQCVEVGQRARAAMESDQVDDPESILTQLREMQLELPEIELILSFHQGRAWAAQADTFVCCTCFI